MRDPYICYRTKCRYHAGRVDGNVPSCNYFFCTGVTKTSRGEADITRKCGLYDTTPLTRGKPQPIVLRGSSPRREPKQRAGRLYDWKQFRALWDEGKNDREIARVIGCNPDTVQKWRHGAGLPPRYRQEIDRVRLKELWEAGMDDPHIAKELGVSTMSAWRARNGMGLPTQKERAKE